MKEKRLLREANLVMLSMSFQVSNLQLLLITHQACIFSIFYIFTIKIYTYNICEINHELRTTLC